jgi:hypothetical protein
MVDDGGPVGLDGVQVEFDDERVVSDAGIMLAATLAERLQLEDLVDSCVRLNVRGAASNAGRKVMALIYAMALGADSIEDCQVLRAGRTGRLLGGWIPAPSTLGTFLRAFTFGHVRQLDRVLAEALKRAWAAGAGPGDERLTVDVDSFVGEVHGTPSRAPRSATPANAATTRSSPAERRPARCCTCACARGRRTRSAGSCASQTN